MVMTGTWFIVVVADMFVMFIRCPFAFHKGRLIVVAIVLLIFGLLLPIGLVHVGSILGIVILRKWSFGEFVTITVGIISMIILLLALLDAIAVRAAVIAVVTAHTIFATTAATATTVITPIHT